MLSTLPTNDLVQARKLADLISQGVSTLEVLSRNANGRLEPEREREREAILKITSASTQLNALVRPPAHVLLDLATGFTLSAALHLVVEANVPEVIRTLSLSKSLASDKSRVHVLGVVRGEEDEQEELERKEEERKPPEEEDDEEGVPVSAIANLCGVQASKLERILRLLSTHHIFVEVPPSRCRRLPLSPDGNRNNTEARFANNRLSEAIDSGARLEDILDFSGSGSDLGDGEGIEDDSGCFLDPGPISVSKSESESESVSQTTGKRKRENLDSVSNAGENGGKKKDEGETKIGSGLPNDKERKSDNGHGHGHGHGHEAFKVLRKRVKDLKGGEEREALEQQQFETREGVEEREYEGIEELEHEGCEGLGLKRRDACWAAKYGSTASGAGLAALVGLLTDESMLHATALTEVLLSSSSPSFSSPSSSSYTSDPDSPYNTAFSRARIHEFPEKEKEMTMFDWLALPENAHRLHRFGCAMRGMGVLTAPGAGAGGGSGSSNDNDNSSESEDGILKGFDFSALAPGSTIIDVGGGVGAASLPILRAYPHLNLNLVVQDTEEVLANARAFWETHLPSALHSGRVTFQIQDFFDPQPAPAPPSSSAAPPDVFLLRMITHNWSDAPCLKILSNLRQAAGEERTKLIVVDSVLMRACRESESESAGGSETEGGGGGGGRGEGDGDGDGKLRMRMMKAREAPEPLLANWGAANGLAYRLDLIMLANHNASERTLAQFDALLGAAGWRIEEVHRGANASESWMPQIVAVPAALPSPVTALGPVG